MFERNIRSQLEKALQRSPIVLLTGARQTGKTTLMKQIGAVQGYQYITFDNIHSLSAAQSDPIGFIEGLKKPVILDEVQRVPEIFLVIKQDVDENRHPGRYVLIGPTNPIFIPRLHEFAGRIEIFNLFPLSLHEIKQVGTIASNESEMMHKGYYPRMYTDGIKPSDWYPDYIRTYIERDVRQIKNISDTSAFYHFMKLCAGRIGQPLNISSLANDCGVSVGTAKVWLSLMEASYIIFMLHPHYKNFNKRLIKSPKLYFYDTGLASHLLGIETAKQLSTHYLRGGLFESFIITELMKVLFNKGLIPHFYFWRDKMGHEVDCIIERAGMVLPIEIKAGKTITQNYFAGLDYWNELAQSQANNGFVVYAGSENQTRKQGHVVGWQSVDRIIEYTESGHE